MNLIDDLELLQPSEKACLISVLSIAIPLAELGIETQQAIALAREQHPGELRVPTEIIATLKDLRRLHYETANLINYWTC